VLGGLRGEGRSLLPLSFRTPHSALVTPVPALVYKNRCPQVSGLPAVAWAKAGSRLSPLGTGVPRFPAPRFRSPVPRFWELSTTAYAQECLSKTIKFGSKSIKKATFSVKKASKRRAFRHAHLNILGGHPLWR